MSSKKFLNEWSILVVPVLVQCLLCRENESKEEKTTISMMTTTLKLNLGHPMILCPRFTCLIAFAPSSITVTTLTHQHASSSSSSPNLRRTHTHSPTLVRSHNSHPFQEPNDQVEDLRVPDHWLIPTTALQVLSFQSQIGIILEYNTIQVVELRCSSIMCCCFFLSLIRNQSGSGLLCINGWMMNTVQRKPMWR